MHHSVVSGADDGLVREEIEDCELCRKLCDRWDGTFLVANHKSLQQIVDSHVFESDVDVFSCFRSLHLKLFELQEQNL